MTENLDAAFPIAFTDRSNSQFDGDQIVELGLSVRDYFAAKAMAALMEPTHNGGWTCIENIAKEAYQIADAMVKEREKVLDELLKE